jgi:hypothetical protein
MKIRVTKIFIFVENELITGGNRIPTSDFFSDCHKKVKTAKKSPVGKNGEVIWIDSIENTLLP